MIERPHPSRKAAAFDELLRRCENSAVYARFCRRVYGEYLGQVSLVDGEQLRLLVRELDLRPGDRVLDLGCGSGRITALIAERSGATLTGVDIAPRAIRRAGARGGEPRVSFQEADMDRLQFAAASFDAALAIDSLYLARDVGRTLAALRACLAPAGRMGLLCSELLPATARTAGGTAADGAETAGLLAELGFSVRRHDLSDREAAIWRRQPAVLAELEPRFHAEGNHRLYRILHAEMKRCLPLVEAGRVRRYLYQARL